MDDLTLKFNGKINRLWLQDQFNMWRTIEMKISVCGLKWNLSKSWGTVTFNNPEENEKDYFLLVNLTFISSTIRA